MGLQYTFFVSCYLRIYTTVVESMFPLGRVSFFIDATDNTSLPSKLVHNDVCKMYVFLLVQSYTTASMVYPSHVRAGSLKHSLTQ